MLAPVTGLARDSVRSPVMPATLGALLQEQAGAITGRERERAQLGDLLEPDGPVVAYVHGLAGVGKTTLLHAFAADARAAGAVTVRARRPRRLRDPGIAARRPQRRREPSVEDAAAALGALGERVVLLVDTYELLPWLDDWICRTLVPALPGHVRVVLAGRDVPSDRWRATARCWLRSRSATSSPRTPSRCCAATASTTGTARADQRDLARPPAEPPARRRGAARPAGPRARGDRRRRRRRGARPRLPRRARRAGTRALDAAALTRRTTLSLLAAMLPDDDAGRGVRAPARGCRSSSSAPDGLRRPRHRPRGDGRAAAGRRPAGVLAPARRGLGPPASRAARRAVARPLALHGRPPLPDRGPGRARGVLPAPPPASSASARRAPRTSPAIEALARRRRRPRARVVGRGARRVRRLARRGRPGRRLRLPRRAGRRRARG